MTDRAPPRPRPGLPLHTRVILALAAFGVGAGAEILTPPYFNLALGKRVTATATCGEEGPELYCKLVGANAERDFDMGNVIQGQVCDYCDRNNASKWHPPENAADGNASWWQSPPLSRGMKYNEVNLTIDLGQEFHVAYVFVRMGNSPRPGLWALEKSTDYGKTFKPWQYFSDSPQDCEIHFGKESLLPITRDDSVICSTEYSQIVPLEGGEIPISLLNYRPSANMYFNSSVLQEWTRATNVRLRLLRTKNLLGHLMSVARQDPTVTRRYFYSIKDISIGGRCMCNGHADTCDPGQGNSLDCRCQHHTCGPQCAACCPGFEQKKWRISQNWNQFACEPCNCHSHTTECEYDAEVDARRQSLDIHGRYEGGGVCRNCQHNTDGINCNMCKPTFFRPRGKLWNETDVCQPCNCDYHYSTGNCAEGTGMCECRPEFNPPRCVSCRYGYYDYPDCKRCPCNLNGTAGDYCTPREGECPCKPNYSGRFCEECADGFYSTECKECECNPTGALSSKCDKVSGNCSCLGKFSGRTCSQCEAGFYNYPECTYCNCDSSGTEPNICDAITGKCMCKEGFGGARCDQCIAGYYMEVRGRDRACVPCNCSTTGSPSGTCAATGKCTCLSNFGGKQCDQCSPGHYQYPECLPCNCDQYGSIGVSCDNAGQCQCKPNFDRQRCDKCREHFYNYPACEECNCDPNGVVASFAGCGSVPAGELCQCKSRVRGRICNDCKPLFWNLQDYNPHGCQECGCNVVGTQGGIGVCETRSGHCSCKLAVGERACTQCLDGFYNLTAGNVFGCTDCDCDIGGSVDDNCDKSSGQCKCHSRIEGRRCDEPIQAHYFPTLHQFQYEVENGRTPSNGPVRYDFSDDVFPGYSWRGYAVFSPPLLTEVINDVQIHKSSVYRMVIRYVNPTRDNIIASIVITPDNPSNVVQRYQVLLKPTSSPQFVTVSGEKGSTPSHFVMDPGKWEVTLKTDKKVYIDYFVLIPQAYYEATVLTKQVEKPCVVGERQLCRHFAYPSLAAFSTVKGSGVLKPVTQYIDDPQQLAELGASAGDIPLVSESQDELELEVLVSEPGAYVFLVEYVTPARAALPAGGTITVKVSAKDSTEGTSDSFSAITLNDCPYSAACRQVLLDELAKVQYVDVRSTVNDLLIQGDVGTLAGIKSVVAIPAAEWHLDYITPRPFCVKKDGQCTPAIFTAAVDSKKVEFETASTDVEGPARPYILDNSTRVVYLHPDGGHLDVQSRVPAPATYMFVVHYYQPDHPESTINVILQADGQYTEAILPITHCPSNSGCRSVVQQADGNTRFPITDNLDLSFKAKSGKGVWLDYFLMVAAEDYVESVLKEANTLDYTRQFITTCAQNHYHVDITDQGFCRDSIFSITSNYNNGALQCFCDYAGSNSFTCNKFGGQCECKPNVIGRSCKQCRPGYYGFPDCRPCDCPSKMCAEDGSCICPPNVVGERCDRCKPETYGFDIVVGCSDCNCHSLGVVDTRLQCDLFNGSCDCKENVVGQTCDRCVAGHYSFPYCGECDCNRAGTTADVCDQDTSQCFCKPNVGGQACDSCLDGHFDLQSDNPDGCTKCFCFGKTARCTSSYLQWAQISGMEHWYLASVAVNGTALSVRRHANPPQLLNSSVIGAELATDEAADSVVYFGAPHHFLGQRLSSYGGFLNYTVFYTSGPFGKAISAGDVILEGPAGSIVHSSYEQPPATRHWLHSVRLIESEFTTPDDAPVSRDLLLTTLQGLRALYVRATYWETSVTTRLEGVTLDVGVDMDWGPGSVAASSVERCQCPAAYKGLSCEQSADGHYRLDSGPHGGFCVPCQCNGHSDTCDVETGVCLNCQDATTGDHCEQCIAGYHGNATVGTPYDCLICACPLPIVSNNFAYSCRVNEAGSLIACECPPGYMGPRCEACAAGYYGNPETPGDYCKPCNCSGNIEAEEPGSCDSITGDCLKCVNNTAGGACHICAPGFYGDAVFLKNCQACICDENGMEYCDNSNGVCVCRPGVVGEKCDRCLGEHWGLASGAGCTPCDCGLAAESRQCSEEGGQCRCAKGVTGQKCDSCAAGYWNYTRDGCDHCNCNTGYSVGFGCNAQTGHCECLPGAVGSKCEQCPHRWVLIPKVGCKSCDSCTGDLLDSVEELNRTLTLVAIEFRNKANSYFTTQRLHYINETAARLRPLVAALDPARVDLLNVTAAVDDVEAKAKNLHRKAEYARDDSAASVGRGAELAAAAAALLEAARGGAAEAAGAVRHVAQLAVSLELGDQPRVDSAIAEGAQISADIAAKDLTPKLNKSAEILQNARDQQERMVIFVLPVSEQNKTFNNLSHDVEVFNNKLKEMLNLTEDVSKTLNKATILNNRNNASKFQSTLNTVVQQNLEAYEDIVLAARLLVNASLAQGAAAAVLPNVTTQRQLARRHCDDVRQLLEQFPRERAELADVTARADEHAMSLRIKTETLNRLLNQLKNNSRTEDAYKAASSHADIVERVRAARAAAADAQAAIDNATSIEETASARSGPALERSRDIERRSLEARAALEELEPRAAAAAAAADALRDANRTANQHLDEIHIFLTEKIPPQLGKLEALRGSLTPRRDVAAVLRELQATRELSDDLPASRARALQLYRDTADANMNISTIDNQIKSIDNQHDTIRELLDQVDGKRNNFDEKLNGFEEEWTRLKEQIKVAKDLASRIKVGVTLDERSTLQPELPAGVDEMGTATRVSAYFRTREENGLLLYLGNPEGSKLRRTRSDDFMALEIANGYPYLLIDIGDAGESGRDPARINHQKRVSDNKWYQVIVERIGKNVKLTIREPLEDGTEQSHVVERVLPGQHTIFNLDREHSRLYVGGYPAGARVQAAVHFNSFNGQIEEVVVGDTPVGLWNFRQAEHLQGARERDRLRSAETSTGYRFNGEGYAGVEARQYVTSADRMSVVLRFRTFAPDGLLYLLGRDSSFLSIEMRDGQLYLQYRLSGGNLVTIGTTRGALNDGKWHTVEVDRYQRQGTLAVDGRPAERGDAGGGDTRLLPAGNMYFGGYPKGHGFLEITDKGFDGCIEDVSVMGTPVDLAQNVEAFGVASGCRYSSVVSLDGAGSFLRYQNVSSADAFQLSLKFKSAAPDGLLFYSTNRDQSAGISLALSQGKLVLRSQRELIETSSSTYNDDKWHVVTATHNEQALKLAVDDYDYFSTDSPPQPLHIVSGELFLGGAPPNYMIVPERTASRAPLVGCIGHVTLNGQVVGVADAGSWSGANIGRCGAATTGGDYSPEISSSVNQPVPFRGSYNGATDSNRLPDVPTTLAPVTTEEWHAVVEEVTARGAGADVATPPAPTTPAPPTTKRTLVRVEGCALGFDAAFDRLDGEPSAGYRFGTRNDSRVEFSRLPGRQSSGYDLAVDFNTSHAGGLVFYATDAAEREFVALFMKGGKLHLYYNCGTEDDNIVAPELYNDGAWHRATLSLDGGRAKLSVDETLVGETSSGCSATRAILQPPLYLGGLAHYSDRIETALGGWSYAPFDGCLKELKMNNAPFTEVRARSNVLPCGRGGEEPGVFFRPPGGYLKLKRFKVGMDMSLSLDIKARNSSGLLVSVHGKRDYLILEIVDNEVILRVDNGKGPFEAIYNLGSKYHMCDGNWHTIYAIKSRHVVSLVVDGHFSEAGVGQSPSTDTTSALFIGGHPKLQHALRGASSRQPFTGCLRNLIINELAMELPLDSAYGAVTHGMCPTD